MLVIKSECNFLASKLHCSNKHNLHKHSTGNCIHHICSINTVWNQRKWDKYDYFVIFFFDHMFLCLSAYESYILHNHKIIFTVFSDGPLWSSGRKPHLKHAFVPCGLFAQSIYRANAEIHRTVYFLKKSTEPYLLQFNIFFVWLSLANVSKKAV